MYRHISVHAIQNNEIRWLSYHVANVLKWTYKDKTNAVGVGGCGMDMGFHLVYILSSILYKDGYALTHRYILERGRLHAARRGVIFLPPSGLPSFLEWQRCKRCNGSQSDHSISVARFMPRKETHLEARGSA